MKILVLGASGLVGKALLAELSSTFDVYGTYYQTKLGMKDDHQLQWNITDSKRILDWIAEINPHIIISCLRGEFDIQLEVHNQIIQKIKSTKTKLLFCSTTNVFDGDITKHHAEDDTPIATSDYGQFKIQCEKLIQSELGQQGVIMRLPMVWGKNSPRLNEIKDKIANQLEVEAYENIYLNHASDQRIAKQIRSIIENDLSGIFHLATTDIDSQYSFISKLVQSFNTDVNIKAIKVDNVEQYNFGLIINRTDLPKHFTYDNNQLISEIV